MAKRRGPLSGIRVLDLTGLYPGPLATMLMGDLGADIIRIEHPNHSDLIHLVPPFLGEESTAYLSLNRSKRSLGLDLSSVEGRSVFMDLVESADIVIEQFRPGVLKRMGIGYEGARARNPRIIYVSLTGFGQEGPYALRAAHDINYIAWSGILSQIKAGDHPVLPALQIADVAGGGYMTVLACLSALWYRERSGRGQSVDVSMVDGVLPLLTLQLAQFWGQTANSPPQNLLDGSFPCYALYRCSDGKTVALGALEPKFWINFCRVVQREQWIPGNFAAGEEGARIRGEVAKLFSEKTREEWMRMAEKHDICLSPVNELKDLEHDPHLKARGMILDIEQKGGARLKGVGIPMRFSESTPDPPDPAPLTGEDSLEILAEAGYPAERVQHLMKKGVVYGGKSKG